MGSIVIGGDNSGEKKPHAVCIPYPAQGHINAMLKLAKLLHFKGFHITFVHTEFNYKRVVNAAPDHGSSSIGSVDDFRFEAIPDGLPVSSDLNSSQDLNSLIVSIRDGSLDGPFRDLLKRLNEPSSGVPLVTCVVSDSFTSFTAGVAKEFEIPDVFFCSTSACGFMGFYHYKELVERGIVPLKSEDDLVNGYLDTMIDWMPGMPNMRLRDLPSFLRTTDPGDVLFNYTLNEAQASRRATAIIVNSFDDLEGPVLDEMSSTFGSVYPIGPLNLLCSQTFGTVPESARSSLWKEDSGCLDWLGGREAGSVIYVNFGSLATMTGQQLIEFAWGLANSGCDFLWIIRPDALVGVESAVLPKEFLAETSGRGFLASWCPQEEVLGHPSIGGFLTHCGWNSTMEALSSGVPMICWPFFADQQSNCRFLCVEWGVGMEVDNAVKREKVEEMIRELLGPGEKGMEMRRKASQWKERAMGATDPGGKSFVNFEGVVKDVLSGRKA